MWKIAGDHPLRRGACFAPDTSPETWDILGADFQAPNLATFQTFYHGWLENPHISWENMG